ncbi:Spermidine family transporter [Schizosaccharomyces pombe]|uniref:Uncharacterized transporter C36.02c n=1 Tax=Schizosaccharomyces pombe (strain 972 / ATCC 24843) TaxID=284812 RepID=YN42_SCHPO|nr:putative spermidine family transporter [Schizosaccharomyces pombe]O59699.1 RecName: Full=Uncharacterized transporter C36.02c [Schizosaccharomyces pombe 972h-]CAA19050.1 spermidine family transporter (predicted) [Schizosaccharomyces pombe]|eukprot:NP_595330.1 putative spermidine family transporter [Schizosaccharomyces pombe]
MSSTPTAEELALQNTVSQSASAHPELYHTVSHASNNSYQLPQLSRSATSNFSTSARFAARYPTTAGESFQNLTPVNSNPSNQNSKTEPNPDDVEKCIQDPLLQVFPVVEEPERFVFSIDPKSPLIAVNWPFKRKLKTTCILAYVALCSSFASSVFAVPAEAITTVFHISLTVSLLTMTVFLLGYCSGPIIWAPLSELSGRKPPILIGMLGFGIFNISVAVGKDIQTIMMCRFFAGFFASAPLTVVAAALADMYSNKYRGTAITLFSAMVFDGPLVSPIVGGFLTKSYLGWRWTEYITSFMGFFALIIVYLFCDETYSKAIIQGKAKEYRAITGNYFVHAKSEEEVLTLSDIAKNYLLVPMKLLFTEPICFLITLYSSFVYAILYLLLEAYPIIFGEKRHFSMGVAELPYIGLLVGVFIGSGINIAFEPWYYRKCLAQGGKPDPEARLPPMMIGCFMFPAGIFWLSWSGHYSYVNWVVPALSGLATGCGILLIFLQCINYLIDAYLFRAASAIAANTIMRSAMAAGFPLFAVQMFHNMGVGWAGSLLGFIATALIPMPFVFFFFGRKIRRMSKMAVDF